VGHSAGGGAIFDAASDPRVVSYVPLSSGVGRELAAGQSAPAKPVLLITGDNDAVAQVDEVREAFAALPSPKWYAELAGATHLDAFSDLCTLGVEQGGILQIAIDAGVAVPEIVGRLFGNECVVAPPSPEEGWEPVRHLVTSFARFTLGIDDTPIGLDGSLESSYAAVPIAWEAAP
jgi:hypothetical protein